ncbi:HTTM domain-containing protein [Actinacidiphila soli]|uniref:HTTM domain-containing protein n=1 Tax=Actinacidiphila soli TaxID=2487275 RepID=UPI0038995065
MSERSIVPSPFAGLGRALGKGISGGLARLTGTAIGRYQTAVVRMGFSLAWMLFLLREWPHRQELYGPDGVWSWDMAHQLIADNHAFSVLMWTRGQLWFEVVYAGAIVASAMLLLGWRTRTASLLFMIGVLSLQNRSVFVGDGGDNVIHLMAIYLVLTRCGQVWSLDSRRRARIAENSREDGPQDSQDDDPEDGSERGPQRDTTGIVLWSVLGAALVLVTALGLLSWGWAVIFWGFWLAQAVWWAVNRYAPDREPRTVLDIFANLAHNGTLLVIIVEVCLIYATAGWYKIQGNRWQDGTALYYPLHLDDFSPWPELSHAMASSGLMVMVITYGTVIVQVAFPFTLFNRRVKNVLLALMMVEHASIAVVLGLPFFSLAMITADAVFLPTGFLRWVGDRVSRRVRRMGGRTVPEAAAEAAPGADAGAQGQPEPSADPAPSNLVG